MKHDDQKLEFGDKIYRALREQGFVLINMDAVERSFSSGSLDRTLYKLMEHYRGKEALDRKTVARLQRAMVGQALKDGVGSGTNQVVATMPVSLSRPADPHLRRALRVLSMVAELHKAGYQRLRIAAGMSPSGSSWRCHITPSDNIRANGWEPIDWEQNVVNYLPWGKNIYFDWPDALRKTARQLAQTFIDRFPEVARRGAGRDRAYAGWFVEMIGAAENGRLPIFFADWDLDLVEVEMPPPPLPNLVS